MSISNPVPAPTIDATGLPVVHAVGSTTFARRNLGWLIAMWPYVGAWVLPLYRGDGVDAAVLAVVAGSTPWLYMASRTWLPLARWSRPVGTGLIGIAWFAMLLLATLRASAEDGSDRGWSLLGIGVAILGAAAATLLAWCALGVRLGARASGAVPLPRPSAATVGAAWSESLVRPWALGGVAASVLVAVGVGVVALTVSTLSSTLLMLIGPLLVVVASTNAYAYRVTADRRGLLVRSLIGGLPLVRVPLDDIALAEAATIFAAEWGQIGSTADAERTAILHRDGPALIVTRRDGTTVVVTVDRPLEAAEVLLMLRDRALVERH